MYVCVTRLIGYINFKIVETILWNIAATISIWYRFCKVKQGGIFCAAWERTEKGLRITQTFELLSLQSPFHVAFLPSRAVDRKSQRRGRRNAFVALVAHYLSATRTRGTNRHYAKRGAQIVVHRYAQQCACLRAHRRI